METVLSRRALSHWRRTQISPVVTYRHHVKLLLEDMPIRNRLWSTTVVVLLLHGRYSLQIVGACPTLQGELLFRRIVLFRSTLELGMFENNRGHPWACRVFSCFPHAMPCRHGHGGHGDLPEVEFVFCRITSKQHCPSGLIVDSVVALVDQSRTTAL